MLAEISARDLAEWEAYERVDGPIGGHRHDLLAASQMALLANINRDRRQHPQPFTDAEFLPGWAQPRVVERTQEDLLAVVEQWNAALGGADLRVAS